MIGTKQGKDQEWRAFAKEINDLRNRLQSIGVRHQKLLPASLMNSYFRIVGKVDQFRAQAEDEMFWRGGPRDITVWYPGDQQAEVVKEEICGV